MTHTKAPWSIGNQVKNGLWDAVEIKDTNEEFIAEVLVEFEVGQSNAHLITAAPDMYEALKHARNTIECGYLNTRGKTSKNYHRAMREIDAVLAQAEGK